MPKIDHPAHELAGNNQGVNGEITLRGLFMLLTESIRRLFEAKYLPEDTRRLPRISATSFKQAGRHLPKQADRGE